MFLKAVTELAVDFDSVRAMMLRDPRTWLHGLAAAAGEDGDRLMVNVGLELAGREVGRRARFEVGQAVETDRVALLPFRLTVDKQAPLFPSLEGSLDAAWLGPGRTHLALSATYEPPLGLLGQAADRALLHRVAETVIQRFLVAIARELSSRARADSRGDGGTSGPAHGVESTPR